MIRNLDSCEYSKKDGEYGGMSGFKEGLIIDGENWLIKYPKNAQYLKRNDGMNYTTDPVSEYIGSQIYGILGYPVHETFLGERKGKIVVACKDFLKKDERLVEIRTLKNSANNEMMEVLEKEFVSTGSSHIVNFNEMLLHLDYNKNLCAIEGVKERFYDQIVIDAFINNSDRNNGNWGIIRADDRPDRLSPVFDNGGSFNGKTPDIRLEKMLKNKIVEGSVLNSISVYGEEKNYLNRDLINFDIKELKESIVKNVPLIQQHSNEIFQMIDAIDERACSQIRKEFYKVSLSLKMELILQPVYSKIVEEKDLETSIEGIDDSFYKEATDPINDD